MDCTQIDKYVWNCLSSYLIIVRDGLLWSTSPVNKPIVIAICPRIGLKETGNRLNFMKYLVATTAKNWTYPVLGIEPAMFPNHFICHILH